MHGDDRPALPPVRLSSEAELATDALAAPLLARAARLAHWAGDGVRVGAGGELLGDTLTEAATHLDLDAEGEEAEGAAMAADAWDLALDIGFLEVEEDEGAEPTLESDEPVGTATGGDDLQYFSEDAEPTDVLEVWRGGFETVLVDAATPSLQDLLGDLEGVVDEEGSIDPDAIDLDAMQWDPEEETAFLDGALTNLYALQATDSAVSAGAMVPLPVLAASLIVPDDMDEPTDEVLEDVSSAMMRLDEQLRLLAPTGLVTYQPVDEELTQEAEEEPPRPATTEKSGELDDEDVARYGMVRLTPLGLYGVRERLREEGVDAPLVGDLADHPAQDLLATLPTYPEDAAQGEVEYWLGARSLPEAARDLLDAARGQDKDAPSRRLACQQALTLAGESAEPALREVLPDRELGGLARVWLAEHGAQDVPSPDEDMVFWLTVDTIAAQLATAGEPEELRSLIQGLIEQHTGFFDKVWQVDHPAAGDVLEAMGRIHPDKTTAKEARKAAFKARSHAG